MNVRVKAIDGDEQLFEWKEAGPGNMSNLGEIKAQMSDCLVRGVTESGPIWMVVVKCTCFKAAEPITMTAKFASDKSAVKFSLRGNGTLLTKEFEETLTVFPDALRSSTWASPSSDGSGRVIAPPVSYEGSADEGIQSVKTDEDSPSIPIEEYMRRVRPIAALSNKGAVDSWETVNMISLLEIAPFAGELVKLLNSSDHALPSGGKELITGICEMIGSSASDRASLCATSARFLSGRDMEGNHAQRYADALLGFLVNRNISLMSPELKRGRRAAAAIQRPDPDQKIALRVAGETARKAYRNHETPRVARVGRDKDKALPEDVDRMDVSEDEAILPSPADTRKSAGAEVPDDIHAARKLWMNMLGSSRFVVNVEEAIGHKMGDRSDPLFTEAAHDAFGSLIAMSQEVYTTLCLEIEQNHEDELSFHTFCMSSMKSFTQQRDRSMSGRKRTKTSPRNRRDDSESEEDSEDDRRKDSHSAPPMKVIKESGASLEVVKAVLAVLKGVPKDESGATQVSKTQAGRRLIATGAMVTITAKHASREVRPALMEALDADIRSDGRNLSKCFPTGMGTLSNATAMALVTKLLRGDICFKSVVTCMGGERPEKGDYTTRYDIREACSRIAPVLESALTRTVGGRFYSTLWKEIDIRVGRLSDTEPNRPRPKTFAGWMDDTMCPLVKQVVEEWIAAPLHENFDPVEKLKDVMDDAVSVYQNLLQADIADETNRKVSTNKRGDRGVSTNESPRKKGRDSGSRTSGQAAPPNSGNSGSRPSNSSGGKGNRNNGAVHPREVVYKAKVELRVALDASLNSGLNFKVEDDRKKMICIKDICPGGCRPSAKGAACQCIHGSGKGGGFGARQAEVKTSVAQVKRDKAAAWKICEESK